MLLGLMAALAIVQAPQMDAVQQPPAAPAAAPTAVVVRDDGLVATWYPPASGKRGPAILALGGSEGGEEGSRRLGAALAKPGFGVLSLAYFRAPGLPAAMEELPLEYFDRALDWLSRQPLVDARRIGVYGVSIGGEAALVVAARNRRVRAVAAGVPSSVVWQGYNPADYRSVRSTFTLAGKPIPFLPYDQDAPFTSVFDLYQRSLAKAGAHADATIPVERIGGAVLLLTGRDDRLWPATAMADQVTARLAANRFAHPYEHVAYPDAGHGAMSPPGSVPSDSARDNIGGTAAGNAAARADMWQRVLGFFGRHLGVPAR